MDDNDLDNFTQKEWEKDREKMNIHNYHEDDTVKNRNSDNSSGCLSGIVQIIIFIITVIVIIKLLGIGNVNM